MNTMLWYRHFLSYDFGKRGILSGYAEEAPEGTCEGWKEGDI